MAPDSGDSGEPMSQQEEICNKLLGNPLTPSLLGMCVTPFGLSVMQKQRGFLAYGFVVGEEED